MSHNTGNRVNMQATVSKPKLISIKLSRSTLIGVLPDQNDWKTCSASRKLKSSWGEMSRLNLVPECGYGACSFSGCNCQAYEGNGSTCGNSGCGHGYDRHW